MGWVICFRGIFQMRQVIFSVIVLCAALPAAAADDIIRRKANTDYLTDADSGFVLASEARFENLYFLNVKTRQEYQSDGSFCGRLPVGHYQLYKINTPYSPVIADEPYEFDVVAGQRHYLGTLVPPWTSQSKKFKAEMAKTPEMRAYSMNFMGVVYNYAVVDHLSVMAEKYQKRCTGVNVSEFTVELMK